jgi:hypothetical protein
MGLKKRGGLLHTEVIPNLTIKVLREVVVRQVQEGTTISTDEWPGRVASTTQTTSNRSGIFSKCRLLQRTFAFRGSISTSTCGSLVSLEPPRPGGTRCSICLWRVFNETFGQILKFFQIHRCDPPRFLLSDKVL